MSGYGKASSNSHLFPEMLQESYESTSLTNDNSLVSPQTGQAFSPAFLSALALLQQNIEHLHTLVRLIAQGGQFDVATTQQQLKAAAGMATVITQLVAVAAGFLPQEQQKSPPSLLNVPVNQFVAAHAEAASPIDSFLPNRTENPLASGIGVFAGNNPSGFTVNQQRQSTDIGFPVGRNGPNKSFELAEELLSTGQNTAAKNNVVDIGSKACTYFSETINSGNFDFTMVDPSSLMLFNSLEMIGTLEDQEPGNGSRDEDDDGDTDSLPPGAYELIELDAMEILAEHTHFCEICGKGFKRDANLRMHMRGHGDEYKTAAALARPDKFLQDASLRRPRRYSCPFLGCKRNKKHKKFLPLKTMLCVKNHYRRSHCPKMLTCTKCKAKKFSVAADLKTHEKHCGKEKWQCSCGTTFSRKDKLLGHVALFLGHTPASPLYETGSPWNGEKSNSEMGSITGNSTANVFGGGSGHDLEVKLAINSVAILGDRDRSAIGAKYGGLNNQSGDLNQGGIVVSESENSGAISGSHVTPLSMFPQTGVAFLNDASDFTALLERNYVS